MEEFDSKRPVSPKAIQDDDRDIVQHLAAKVLGCKPHIYWNPLNSIGDAWMLVEKLRDEWTAETAKHTTPATFESFVPPFDYLTLFQNLNRSADSRWQNPLLYLTPRAISMAVYEATKDR